MQVHAQARFIRVSSRKMNIVAGLIRGKSLIVARKELTFRPERAARLLLDVVNSAAANALENHSLDVDGLTIAAVTVGQGPRLKRYTPRAFGRASPIAKPTSHVTVVVEGEKTIAKAIRRTSPAAAATPAKTPVKPSEVKGGRGPAPKGFFRRIFQRKSGM